MSVKNFIINPDIVHVPKFDLEKSVRERERRMEDTWFKQELIKDEILLQKHTLKAPQGKVIIQIDVENKNWWQFENGQKIRYERQFDNFNRRHTEPVNAVVIDAENIPVGSEILIHPNAIADHHKIYNYIRESHDIKYYSIPQDMCFCYLKNDQWHPLPPYEKALRVFQPYRGKLLGIEPKQINDCLYVLTGDLKGKVVMTVKASDYCVVFQNIDGREGNLIRFRPHGDGKDKEPEAIAIHHEYTKNVKRGTLLVGFTKSDAKTLNEYFNG